MHGDREYLIQEIVDRQVLNDFGINALAPVGQRDEISKRQLLWEQHRQKSDEELSELASSLCEKGEVVFDNAIIRLYEE
jgi:hypothetical protein